MKGIVTIATKHALYGRYAYNLAVSLRAIAPQISISIIGDNVGLSHLTDTQKCLFDKIITPELNDYHKGDKCTPLTLKYHLHKYSPYDQTIFMDADTILSPMADVEALFTSLEGIEFTIANRGEQKPEKGVSQWIDSSNVEVPYWYDLSSEFIYFEKSKKANDVFLSALKHYKNDSIPVKSFAGDKPDEPYLMMGMITHGVKPHKTPFKPSYWLPAEKFKSLMDIKRSFTMFSLGGKLIPRAQMNYYNELCKNASYKSGLQTMSIHPKMNTMQERKVI
jgi:hypothetical protein